MIFNNYNGSFSFIAGRRRAFVILEFLYSTGVSTVKCGCSFREVFIETLHLVCKKSRNMVPSKTFETQVSVCV